MSHLMRFQPPRTPIRRFNRSRPSNKRSWNWRRVGKNYAKTDEVVRRVTGKRIHQHAWQKYGDRLKDAWKRYNKPSPKQIENLERLIEYYENERTKTIRKPPKFKVRRPSHTETKEPPKAYRRRAAVQYPTAGGSSSSYTCYKRAGWISRIYRRLSPMQMYQIMGSSRTAYSQNLQSASSVPVFSTQDLLTLSALTESKGGSVTPATMSTVRFLVQKARVTYTFSNTSNANMSLNLYELVCRRETGEQPWWAFVQGMREEMESSSSITGSGRVDTLVADNYGANMLGTTPYQSSYFCRRWYIAWRRRLILAPGQTHTHTASYFVNRYFSQDDFDDSGDEGDPNQKGLTRSLMYIVSGSPASDGTNVAMSHGAVDVIWTVKYTYRYIEPTNITYVIKDTIPKIATEQIMNEETGAISSVTSL